MDTSSIQLRARVASLETQVDMLETELMDLNDMLIRVGFPNGVQTLKGTVIELLAEDASHQERPELI